MTQNEKMDDTSPIDDERLWTEMEFKGRRLETAVLVGTFRGNNERQSCEEHLDELELLSETFGVHPVAKIACPLRKIDASTFLGKGKLAEIADLREEKGAQMMIFDDDILPSQQRNLESLFRCPVMDRTEVILDVFAQRAQTREAKLQIEHAQVKYTFPRLKRLWTHLSRQRGGGVFLKGEGEKQIEIDRRLLQKRLERLERDLKEVQQHRETQRTARQRQGIPTFAIIGYTNVGKSTLLRALTDADVLVEDKLFATLDTTTRKFTLPNNQDILLIDTVGFIRKLPHNLVAAFRGTLEESVHADILLHLIDASHPAAEEQADASLEVLATLHAENRPIITVINKIDKCEDRAALAKWRAKHPRTVQISAATGEGFEDLMEIMGEELSKLRQIVKVSIPQSEYALVSEITRDGNILHQEYEDNNVLLRAEVPSKILHKLEPFLVD